MRGVRGFLTGALGLIVLEIIVSNRNATGRVTGLFAGITKATDWLLDPGTPGIPDRTKNAATQGTITAAPSSSLLPAPPIGTKTPAYASASGPTQLV